MSTSLKDFFLGNSSSGKNNTFTTSSTPGIFSGFSTSGSTLGTTFYTGMNSNSSSRLGIYVKQILSYLFGIAIVIFIIMLFIHFFITPVFSLQPGAPGIFVVPGLDDGVLFWNKSSPTILPNKSLPIQNMDYGYCFMIDLFIENPHVHFSKHPRILFRRGGTLHSKPTGDTLLGLVDNYNVIAALLPDTNDLMISVLNSNNNTENAIISNIPVQEPFRVGVVIMDYAMEVYINGHLMKTRTFSAVPKSVKGDIYPISGTESSMAKMRNLKIWSRLLTSSEIRYAEPSMSTGKDFGSGQMSTTSSCAILDDSNNALSDTYNKVASSSVKIFSNTYNK
jgi:hypothetical protein